MPDFDLGAEIPLGKPRNLLEEEKPSAASRLFSDAYGWAAENKLAAAGTVALAAAGAYALLRGGVGNIAARGAAADVLGAGQRFVVQDASVLGGRIAVNSAESLGARALATESSGARFALPQARMSERPIAVGTAKPGASEIFVAEGGDLGGRIVARQTAAPPGDFAARTVARQAPAADDAFTLGQRALSAPLHEIPTFAPTLRGDFLPRSVVQTLDKFAEKTGIKLLGR